MTDIEAARQALSKLTAAAWGDPTEALFSIPARHDRDADLIVGAALDELAALQTWRAAAEPLLRALLVHSVFREAGSWAACLCCGTDIDEGDLLHDVDCPVALTSQLLETKEPTV